MSKKTVDPLQKAFQLLDEYNTPATSGDRVETIVILLHTLGFAIRPLKTITIKDDGDSEVLHAGSNAWGLVDRHTGRPVERETS